MEVVKDIFEEFAGTEDTVSQLFEFLSDRLPEGAFQLIRYGNTVGPGKSLFEIPESEYPDLVQRVHSSSEPVSFRLGDRRVAYALPVDAVDGVLAFVLPHLRRMPRETALVSACIELFFSRKAIEESETLLTIQKKQLHRQLSVLEKRYQEILEDNHRSYQIIREQQESYSQRLKSEINRQTAALRKANRELNAKRRFQQKLLDTAATAIYTVDPHQRITDVNEEFCVITGFTKEEVVGRHMDLLRIKPGDDLAGLIHLGKRDRIVKKQCTLYTKEGEKRKIIKSSDVLLDEAATVVGAVESFVDVTELIEARENAEAASKAKSAFLAAMSHEIRTPMNAVIGFTDILMDSDLNEYQTEQAKTIKQSGTALLSLINDILDFSKVEAGQLDLECIDFDPEMTAFDVCGLVRSKASNKPIEILCRIGEEVPPIVNGDPGRFRQVLINLIDNAVKFTEAGEIELFLDVEAMQTHIVKCHITVRDTGIGIPKDKQEGIFDSFQQADGSMTRKYGGTGLGLAICKKLANLMEGNVWVESPAPVVSTGGSSAPTGPGSLFHFTCWFNKSGMVPEKNTTSVCLAGQKVLVVDDNEANLDIITHMLVSFGTQFECLRSAGPVLQTLQDAADAEDPFSICILDTILEDTSGLDVARRIRSANASISRIPLLAFSSSVEKNAKECRESGFDAFLPKPIRQDNLYRIMEQLVVGEVLDRNRTQDESSGTILTQYSLREADKHSVQILLAEDNHLNQRLAVLMLAKAGYQVEVAGDGKEAVEKFSSTPGKFNLVFMDIQMPEMDGFEATAEIRALEQKTPAGKDSSIRIPIIAMTANAMKGDRERCIEAGMDDYVTKPIQREIVYEIIDKWVLEKTDENGEESTRDP